MRWRRRRAKEIELGELDPFLLSLVARLAAARGSGPREPDDWVSINHVAALCRQMADAAVETLGGRWAEEAEQRMLVERRMGPQGVEVRLTPKGRDFMEPLLG